jgi:serine protease SohB
MTILFETLGFAARAAIVFVTFAACVAVVALSLRGRRGARKEGRLEVTRLNERFERLALSLRLATLSPRATRAELKAFAAEQKRRVPSERRAFVLDFKGDVLASAVEHLREEVTAVLAVARPADRVVLRLESPGGAAHSYGLAASQIARLRERGVHVTACVDRVAASGGYMMACVANEIVAAPFAIVGSIGVAAPVPNAHRLLERNGVDYETATAGRYKRTVTFFGAITDEGRRKFQEQLEETHALFKGFVQRHRPTLDVEAIATGEYWHGEKGHELRLVDRLATSDDVLRELSREFELLGLRYHARRGVVDRLSTGAASVAENVVLSLVSRLETPYT